MYDIYIHTSIYIYIIMYRLLWSGVIRHVAVLDPFHKQLAEGDWLYPSIICHNSTRYWQKFNLTVDTVESWNSCILRSLKGILLKNLLQGMFVVRESVNVPGSFVLSLIHKGETQHFQINASPHSGCFSIDNGPPFVGLDQLIRFYK